MFFIFFQTKRSMQITNIQESLNSLVFGAFNHGTRVNPVPQQTLTWPRHNGMCCPCLNQHVCFRYFQPWYEPIHLVFGAFNHGTSNHVPRMSTNLIKILWDVLFLPNIYMVVPRYSSFPQLSPFPFFIKNSITFTSN